MFTFNWWVLKNLRALVLDLPPTPAGKSCTLTGNCSNCVTHAFSFATKALKGVGLIESGPLKLESYKD